MSSASSPPILFLSAMGADERLFREQVAVIAGARVVPFIAPLHREPLRDYAARFAAMMDPGEPCFLVGASFGGMLAMEVAKHLRVKACFLIGSIRSADELPRRFRVLRPLAAMAAWPVGFGPWAAKGMRMTIGRWLGQANREVLDQLCDADRRFVRWATWAVLTWNGDGPPAGIPVYQIHGASDWVLPASRTSPEERVPGAGHLLPATHGEAVTAFIVRHLA